MISHFAQLGLPLKAALQATEVRHAFQKARSQPDLTETEQQALQEASHCLQNPATRLAHLQAVLGAPPSRGATISEDLMQLFSRITPALQAADDLISRQTTASSALAKALLSKNALAMEETLATLGGQVMEILTKLHQACEHWDGLPEKDQPLAALPPLQHGFAFLEKWERELQNRRLGLVR